jgi:hypothetical protein
MAHKISREDFHFVIIITVMAIIMVFGGCFGTVYWGAGLLPGNSWWWLATPVVLGFDFIIFNNTYYILEVIAKVTSPGYEIQDWDWPDLLRKKK